MATVFCSDQKQITLPHSTGHEEGRWEGVRNIEQKRHVIKFDPVTRQAEVSDYEAEVLVRLFPNSCFVVKEAPKSKGKG